MKNAEKSEQTKELIEQNFMELLEEQPLSEISVNDIAGKSGVNRNTFYYHFKNVADLLESVMKGMLDQVIVEHPPAYESLEECLLSAIKMAKDNEKIVYHVYNSANRRIFERCLWRILDHSTSSFIDSFEFEDKTITETERQILKTFFKYECFGFVIDWINNGMSEDVTNDVKALVNFILSKNILRHQ